MRTVAGVFAVDPYPGLIDHGWGAEPNGFAFHIGRNIGAESIPHEPAVGVTLGIAEALILPAGRGEQMLPAGVVVIGILPAFVAALVGRIGSASRLLREHGNQFAFGIIGFRRQAAQAFGFPIRRIDCVRLVPEEWRDAI